MRSALPGEALNQIFREARTQGAWLDKPVSDETLRQLYDLMKWGPTSANGSPARFRQSSARDRNLKPQSNRTLLVAQDARRAAFA
jgi:3-hydroxypropanoate dehydrogenase